MKGVILAGGSGSRLFPLTKVINKNLLPVGNKPMIYHPIGKLVEAGIEEILIVTGVEHMGDIVSLLGSGRDFGCKFTYKVQDEPGGIAQALGLAENFVGNDFVTVILGDNIFGSSLKNRLNIEKGAKLFLKEVPDPQRYGVAEFDSRGVIIGVKEKPKKPKSNRIVTGIYIYDSTVFSIIKTLKPSARGELEITDVNNHYIKNFNCEIEALPDYWTDAGTFESLQLANELVMEDMI